LEKNANNTYPHEGRFNELRVNSWEWLYLYSEAWNHS